MFPVNANATVILSYLSNAGPEPGNLCALHLFLRNGTDRLTASIAGANNTQSLPPKFAAVEELDSYISFSSRVTCTTKPVHTHCLYP